MSVPHDDQERVLAVVALKSPERAKSRLAGWLSPAQRRQLLFTLAERSIRALHATPGIGPIHVVSASLEVAEFARALGAQPLLQDIENGTAAAFAHAIEQLRPQKPRKLLMLAGDLPLIDASALQSLCDAADHAPVVIAPDRHRLGTNALLCSPPGLVSPSFGSDSFSRHLLAARAATLDTRVLQMDALALDLDRPEDFNELQRLSAATADALMAALQKTGSFDARQRPRARAATAI
jgi:2-phospho-L-lactate guanylyltransferase